MILSFSLGEQAVVGIPITRKNPILGSTNSSTLLASIHFRYLSLSLSLAFRTFAVSVLENEYNIDQN